MLRLGYSDAVEQALDNRILGDTVCLGFEAQHDAMPKHRIRECFDVVACDMMAAAHDGTGFRGEHDVENAIGEWNTRRRRMRLPLIG